MSEPNSATALSVPVDVERMVEYQAFGSAEDVKLSINIVKKWLVTPTRTGKLPTDSDVMKFMMLCRARQLNPWEGDAFLVGYDSGAGATFTLITAHQAFLKRAEVNPEYDGMQSGVIVDVGGVITDLEGDFHMPDQKLLGAWAKVYRKGQAYPKVARLNIEIFDKDRSLWKTNRAGMIVKCAEADALRGAFPNTLGGMYSQEEQALIGHTEGGDNSTMAKKTRARATKLRDQVAPSGTVVEPEPDFIDAEVVEPVEFKGIDEVGEAEPLQAGDELTFETKVEPKPADPEESKLEDLRASSRDRYRELKGDDKLKADKFLGTKGISDLGADKLTDFLNIFGE